MWHTQLIVCAENVKSWFKSWVFPKYGDYEYATIGSVVNKNFDSRFEVICLKILGTEFSAWAT